MRGKTCQEDRGALAACPLFGLVVLVVLIEASPVR
jgi:hypothetical protein